METNIIAALTVAGVLLAAVAVTVLIALLAGRAKGAVYEYDQPDFTGRAGFRAARLPEDDLLRLERVTLNGSGVAQLEYRVQPAWKLVLRVGRAGADLGAEQFGADFRERVTMYYKDVRVTSAQSEGGPALVFWSRGGFDHLLALPDTEMGLRGGLMPLFVEGAEMVESKTA